MIFNVRFSSKYGIFFRRTHRFLEKELSWKDEETIKETIAAYYVEKDTMKAKQ